MKKEGYVVTNADGFVLLYSKDPFGLGENESLLAIGSTGTLFSTREAADKAIADSIAYEQRGGYDWGTKGWCVSVVTEYQVL